MERRSFMKGIGAGGLALLLQSCTPKYIENVIMDFEERRLEESLEMIEKIKQSTILLDCVVKYKLIGNTEDRRKGYGVHKDGYIMTVRHFTHVPPIINTGLFGVQPFDDTKQTSEMFLNGKQLEMIASDKESDISLYKTDQDIPSFPAPLGDSDKLRVGQKIILVGNPGLEGWNTRFSRVTRVNAQNYDGPDFGLNNKSFGMDEGIIRGDSGTPVVDANNFELLGLSRYTMWQGNNGFATKINNFKKYMK